MLSQGVLFCESSLTQFQSHSSNHKHLSISHEVLSYVRLDAITSLPRAETDERPQRQLPYLWANLDKSLSLSAHKPKHCKLSPALSCEVLYRTYISIFFLFQATVTSLKSVPILT